MPKDELIEALEKATGPCGELDAAIFAVAYPERVPSPIFESGYGWRFEGDGWWLATGEDARVPPKTVTPARYTSSIDAALTLVPEGWLWRIMPSDFDGWLAEVWTDDTLDCEFGVRAKTPALAICIAALRAKGDE